MEPDHIQMLVHETFTFSLNKDNMPSAFAYDYHNQRWVVGGTGSSAEAGAEMAKEEEGVEATPKGGLSKRAKKMLLKKKEEKQEEVSSSLVATGAIEVGTIVRFKVVKLDLADRVYSWHGSIVEGGMGAIGFKARPVPIELTGYARFFWIIVPATGTTPATLFIPTSSHVHHC